jgi:archaellum component FlaC
MATQSIRIPVELELKNIQEAINSLKGGLKGVSKESGFYKTISKEIDQVEKKYRELSAVASRPFTNVSSITSFENQFLKLGDRITNIGKAFSELSFKDLDLKGIPNAEEQFKNLTNQVR